MVIKQLRKKAFVLLELLIAMSLLSLCALPLLQMPFQGITSEIKSCQRIHLKGLSDLTFADIESQLHQNAIPWDELDVGRNEKTELFNDLQTLSLEGVGERKFKRKCHIWSSRRKAGKNREQFRLVTIELEYKALKEPHFFIRKKSSSDTLCFRHQLFVAQIPPSEQKTS